MLCFSWMVLQFFQERYPFFSITKLTARCAFIPYLWSEHIGMRVVAVHLFEIKFIGIDFRCLMRLTKIECFRRAISKAKLVGHSIISIQIFQRIVEIVRKSACIVVFYLSRLCIFQMFNSYHLHVFESSRSFSLIRIFTVEGTPTVI
jgi:hypothetical protein